MEMMQKSSTERRVEKCNLDGFDGSVIAALLQQPDLCRNVLAFSEQIDESMSEIMPHVWIPACSMGRTAPQPENYPRSKITS
jgi:hypothetical protein